uniref:Reverse transcriptase domain-containing protein n=1 Tax=Tanacetum cinerariifolium TaxID=118510 RepID=A0A6L2JHR7_TANCI|nr:hypothetical protein [Tanacetum cinerariifolium]
MPAIFEWSGCPIAPIAIHAMNFGLKNDMIQQVQNSCQFHGLLGDDANKHLDKFLRVTQSIKVNGVTDDALRLYLFPHSLTHHATAWRNLHERRPKECYNLIENMTAHHNNWDTSAQQSESSSSITSSFDTEIAALKAEMAKINKNCMRVLQVNLQVKAVTLNCETCGGPYSFFDCPTIVGQTQNVYAVGAYQGNHNPQGNNQGRNQFFQGANQGENQPPAYQAPVYQASVHQPQFRQPQVVTTNEFTNFIKENDAILKNMQINMTSLTNSNLELKNMFGMFMKINTASSSGLRTLPGNIITNPKEDLKGITTRSGTAYQGPTIPTTSLPPVVERETEATKDTVHPTNNRSTEDVQPLVVLTESLILNSELVATPIIEPVASPVSALKPNQRPSIPYPSIFQDQKLRDKANDQREKFFQIFKDLNFNISFVDALILMPKFGPSIKSLLSNKDKLCELAKTPLNEHFSTVLLKKLPKKLGDPGKFLISCDFLGMVECLALVDLDASINLMPLSMWNNLSFPDLSPTCMTLELVNRSISRLVRVAEDVFVKVGTFHFPADFIVVDFDADPRVPLILGISFLKTRRALIDVFEGELTLRVGKEAITFNLDQTLRYSAIYNDMMANRIDVINMACEEYSQEVLGFSDVIASGNPTPYYDPIVSTTSPTLTPFENNDFLLEEVDAFLALKDDPTSPKVNQSYELKIREAKSDKSSIDEPPEVKLKDLPPRLEYAFLEGNDKFLVIIVKDLNVEEKIALITVLKSHKRAIAWKLSDIKDQEKTTFTCTYRTFAYRRMPFRLSNAPGTFQRCMMDIFHDMIKKTMEVFMDDFSVFRNSFQTYLAHLERMLKRCEDTNLCLNWEKSHFMVKEGAENLAVDHLSRQENPHQNVLDPKEINESFPLETLNLVSTRDNSSTPWFADFANYHARNFVVKGMSSPQKPLTFSRLATMDPPEDTMAQITQPRSYKEKTKRLHDSKIKDRVFNIGDRVLLFNSRLKIFSGKLKSHWSGPFTISHVFPYGTVELSQPDGPNFKVNGHRLKHYFGEDVPKMVVPNLQTFPKDH